MSKKAMVTILVISLLAVGLAAGYIYLENETSGKRITVLAAGSLAVPFENMA